MKRLFTLALGLGAGLLLGAALVRRVDTAAKAVMPEALMGRVDGISEQVTERIAAFRTQAQQHAAAREAELRAAYDVPPVPGATPRV